MNHSPTEPGVRGVTLRPRGLRGWLGKRSTTLLHVRRAIKRRLGVCDPLRLDLYGGYAGAERATIWGRALEDPPPSAPTPDDTWRDNLRRSLRQLESDEVPNLSLRVSFSGVRERLVTDDEGYFCAQLRLQKAPEVGWAVARAEVIDEAFDAEERAITRGEILVPSADANFGVISDIDDTILQSHVRNRFKQAYLTLFGNAITRLSYAGTAALYQGLQRAGEGAPFFYVSRSAWNIHALLDHFIRHQHLPRGALVLRDVGLFNHPEQRRGHKRREIERIFQTFPRLRFVLIGDSGQADTTIYRDIAIRYPGRVRAILIRKVSSDRRLRQLRAAVTGGRQTSAVPCLFFEHSDEARAFCRDVDLWRPGG